MIRVNDKVVKIKKPWIIFGIDEDGFVFDMHCASQKEQRGVAQNYRKCGWRVLTFNIEDEMMRQSQEREELAQIRQATDSVPK